MIYIICTLLLSEWQCFIIQNDPVLLFNTFIFIFLTLLNYFKYLINIFWRCSSLSLKFSHNCPSSRPLHLIAVFSHKTKTTKHKKEKIKKMNLRSDNTSQKHKYIEWCCICLILTLCPVLEYACYTIPFP